VANQQIFFTIREGAFQSIQRFGLSLHSGIDVVKGLNDHADGF